MFFRKSQTSPTPRPFPRADERLARELQAGRVAVDQQVFWGLLAQWGFVLAAVLISSVTNVRGSTDLLCMALLIQGALSVGPLWLTLRHPGKERTRSAVAICQGLVSTVLFCATAGRLETHLHLFVWLVVLAGYRETGLLVLASASAVASHAIAGLLGFGPVWTANSAIHLAEHAVWLVIEAAALMTFIRIRVQSMTDLARREAALESLNNNLERKVERRTREMSDKFVALQREHSLVQQIRSKSEADEQTAVRELSALRLNIQRHATTLMDTTWQWTESHFDQAFRPNWRTIRETSQQLFNLVDQAGLRGMSLDESLVGGSPSEIERAKFEPAETSDFTPAATQQGPKSLLLIDDPIQQTLAEHALKANGFDVDVVHSGPRTYYSAMLREYELIVIDLDLANEEGYDTIEALRLLPSGITDETGLFALSKDRTPESVLRSTQLGIDGFFVKPLSVEALRSAIQGAGEPITVEEEEAETVGVCLPLTCSMLSPKSAVSGHSSQV
jgi:CheY-like chemotaxis protein